MKTSVITKLLILCTIVAIGASSLYIFLNTKTSAAAFFGAIYTSTFDGGSVNQNTYPSKDAVYLNGGPQNQNGNGLPDGTYYFQVTNPSGSTLLSTDDAVCRQVTVVGGKVAGVVQRISDVPSGPRPDYCPAHPNGVLNSSNGSTPVQIVPYDDTPNSGGEYKLWLIRQATNTTIAGDGKHLNFNSNNSKTDNFKIETPPCTDCEINSVLNGKKFYDANANALFDQGELPVEGIKIEITVTDGTGTLVFITTTDPSGNWSWIVPTGATYSVREILPITCPDEVGSYWVQTAPVADDEGFQGYSGTANGNQNGLDFGDICFHPASGGNTLGYWSNKVGQREMTNGAIPTTVDPNVYPVFGSTDNPPNPPTPGNPGGDSSGMTGDLNFLTRLHLKANVYTGKKITSSTDFDPNNYNAFRSWLLDGNATNMAYMLSVQLAATSLNARHKHFSDSQIVDATSVGLGLITIGEVRIMANRSLYSNSITISGDPHRDSQELMKNFLDAINNNLLPFASGTPCSVCYPPPPPPPSPTPTELQK